MGLLKRLFGGGSAPAARFERAPTQFVDASWLMAPTFSMGSRHEVKGEASYQAHLERIAGGRNEHGTNVTYVTALLVPEPTNPYDPSAVRVDIAGGTVGYIPRGETAKFHPVLKRLAREGRLATCRAELTGGWERGPHDRGHIGVRLLLHPALETRGGDEPIIGGGRNVDLVGEEHAQEYLERQLGSSQSVFITLELRVLPENPLKKSAKGSVVGAFHDDGLVGVMTPTMTERYAPLVEEAERNEVRATVVGHIERKAKKIEVQVKMPDLR